VSSGWYPVSCIREGAGRGRTRARASAGAADQGDRPRGLSGSAPAGARRRPRRRPPGGAPPGRSRPRATECPAASPYAPPLKDVINRGVPRVRGAHPQDLPLAVPQVEVELGREHLGRERVGRVDAEVVAAPAGPGGGGGRVPEEP